MDLESIINEVADQADDLLADCTTRKEARTALSEHIQSQYPELDPDDRLIVMGRVIQILEDEEFFAASPGDEDTVWGEGAADVDEPIN